jgi:hypothetical protein
LTYRYIILLLTIIHEPVISPRGVGLKGKVIAIEPQKDAFEMLNRSVVLKKLTNVTTLNRVIYSEETKVNF